MKILGISCYYHDSSACLLIDGKVVSAVAEERLTRKKHDSSFPINAINFCLSENGLTIKDIDYITFYEKPILKFERFLKFSVSGFPKTYLSFVSLIPAWIKEKLLVLRTIKKKLKYKKQVFFISHHVSHAGAFFSSPFDEAVILVIDGVGEFTTSSYGYGKHNRIEIKKEINFPNSIGLLYSAITSYLGFSVNDSEYKVMGLSAYGNMNKDENEYYKKLKNVISINQDGSFSLDLSYFEYQYGQRMCSEKIYSLLGGKLRKENEEITERHKDIAAAVQLITEEVVIDILNKIQNEFQSENLVFCGGVALNSVLNGKILSKTKFKKVWITPDPGDGGTSIGCALYLYNQILNNPRVESFDNAYLGPEFSNDQIRTYLDNNKIKYREFDNKENLIKEVSKIIFDNKVVGWFQGKMEFGPRALGNRSILANPLNREMQDILNLRVKHREQFRPFAPVVTREEMNKYFEADFEFQDPCKYMLMVYLVKKEWRSILPAVTHVDGTGRLQTVSEEDNKDYYRLIKEFEKLSGLPILVNTSFNIRGEPIVCTPKDAYRCMMGTEIDYLAVGRFLVKREENIIDDSKNREMKKQLINSQATNKTKKFFGFLIFLLGIIFNPIVVSYLYAKQLKIQSIEFSFLFFVEIVLIVLGSLLFLRPEISLIKNIFSKWKEILLFVFCLIVVDFMLSFVVPHSYRINSKYGWQIGSKVIINTIRDTSKVTREVRSQFFENNFRRWGDINTKKKKILIIGDSFTQDVQVNNGEEWYSYLERAYTNVEFFVFGTQGYGTLQEYMVLDDFVDQINPDVVLLQFTMNDYQNNYHPLDKTLYPYSNIAIRPYFENGKIVYRYTAPWGFLRKYSAVLDKILAVYDKELKDIITKEDFDRKKTKINILKTKYISPEAKQKGLDITMELVGMFKNRIGDADFYMLVPKDISGNEKKLCDGLKINCIPLNDLVESQGTKDDPVHPVRDSHWNLKGNRIVGQELVKYFVKNNVFYK